MEANTCIWEQLVAEVALASGCTYDIAKCELLTLHLFVFVGGCTLLQILMDVISMHF